MFLQSRNRLAVTENRLVFATGVRWRKRGLGIPITRCKLVIFLDKEEVLTKKICFINSEENP